MLHLYKFSRATTFSDDWAREIVSYNFDYSQQVYIPLLNVHTITPTFPRPVFVSEQNHLHGPSAHEAMARHKARS